MATLIIHAPEEQQGKRSYKRTIDLGVGEGYAIPEKWVNKLKPGDTVVVLRKSKGKEKRHEGSLIELVPAGKAGNGMKRYDVHMHGLKPVKYKPEGLGRTGVSFRDDDAPNSGAEFDWV